MSEADAKAVRSFFRLLKREACCGKCWEHEPPYARARRAAEAFGRLDAALSWDGANPGETQAAAGKVGK